MQVRQLATMERTCLLNLLKVNSSLISSSEIHAEWNTYHNYITKQPKDLQEQLTQLVSNEMLVAMFPNLSTLYLPIYSSWDCIS